MRALQADWRRTDGAVDLFALFLEGTYDSAQLHFALAVEDTLDDAPFGVAYPSPDAECVGPRTAYCYGLSGCDCIVA